MKKSFTLAEVLITLAVIGIVASLTIPIVIRNYQERQTVTSLKKFYSDINQAFQMATVHKGKIENAGITDSTELFEYFKPYLKISKICGTKGNSDCFYKGEYTTLNPSVPWSWKNFTPNEKTNYYKVVMSNGVSVWFSGDSVNCGTKLGKKPYDAVCGAIGVDLNGVKKPNRLGVDTFYFRVTKYGNYPMEVDNVGYGNLNHFCKLSSTEKTNGYACTAWVIIKGNMDYLKHDISW